MTGSETTLEKLLHHQIVELDAACDEIQAKLKRIGNQLDVTQQELYWIQSKLLVKGYDLKSRKE
jgi:cob(I)alamin adenosyltransferase